MEYILAMLIGRSSRFLNGTAACQALSDYRVITSKHYASTYWASLPYNRWTKWTIGTTCSSARECPRCRWLVDGWLVGAQRQRAFGWMGTIIRCVRCDAIYFQYWLATSYFHLSGNVPCWHSSTLYRNSSGVTHFASSATGRLRGPLHIDALILPKCTSNVERLSAAGTWLFSSCLFGECRTFYDAVCNGKYLMFLCVCVLIVVAWIWFTSTVAELIITRVFWVLRSTVIFLQFWKIIQYLIYTQKYWFVRIH